MIYQGSDGYYHVNPKSGGLMQGGDFGVPWSDTTQAISDGLGW